MRFDKSQVPPLIALAADAASLFRLWPPDVASDVVREERERLMRSENLSEAAADALLGEHIRSEERRNEMLKAYAAAHGESVVPAAIRSRDMTTLGGNTTRNVKFQNLADVIKYRDRGIELSRAQARAMAPHVKRQPTAQPGAPAGDGVVR